MIKNGGDHGDSFGSDLTVPVEANSFTEALLDAGQPEGIAPGSEIESCEPHLEDVDISDVSTGEIFSQSSVKILKSGSS